MPPEAGPDRPDGPLQPGQNLPAPYQDPVAALGRDLQAVVASLRLRLLELGRRNRQGDLSVPGFWPKELAPLFWPLLLALGLAVLVALPIGVGRLLPQPAQPEPDQPAKLLTTPLPQARPTAEAESIADPLPAAEAPAPLVPIPELGADPEPPPLQLDPLLALLRDDDPRHLIANAQPDPGAGLLQLQLGEAFALLPPAERSAEANHWLERSQALGYERLQLLDGAGRLLGRQALAGSGMILLDESTLPR